MTLLTGNFTNHERNKKQRGKKQSLPTRHMKKPYEAHQICDACEEEDECFHGENV